MVKRVLVVAVAVALTGVAVEPVDAVQRPVQTKAMPTPETGKRISFGAVNFDPLRDALQFRPASGTEAGSGLRFVQFRETPRQDWIDALSANGLEVLQYYPDDTYLVWGDAAAASRTESLSFVRWQGDYSPDFKQSPELKGKLGLIDNVQVLLYDDGNLSNALAAIEGMGGQVLNVFDAQPDGKIKSAIVRLDAGRQVDVRSLPQVIWTEYASPRPQFDDEMSSQIVAGNYNASGQVTGTGYIPFITNLGLSGDGVTWAVTDSGIDYANPELAARITDGHDYPGCPTTANQPGNDNSSGGHGTHVAGIVGGAGVVAGGVDGAGYHYGIGIAPQVDLVALNPICIGSVPWPPAGGWQELSKRALLKGAIGTNNSWTSGEGAGVGYNASARTHDFMVRDGDFDTPTTNQPFVIVFSAGNSGSGASTITAPKEAKNPIIVGASRNQRVGSIEALASFSSRGPAIDGRQLPTISAPGEQIASTRRVAGASQCGTAIGAAPLNNYAFCSGTSMASPQVAGLSALLVEWWRDNNNGATPSPAMIKALLVNGAVDMTGVTGFPNNNEGWGRIHLPGSIALGRQAAYVDQDEVLTDVGQVYERTLGVPSSTQPVRITLAWTDAPGAAGANPALVNNLDLEVVANGQTFRGNVFTNGQSVPGGTADNRNIVENVYLPAGVGSVTIRVRATALPGDGVPNFGDATDQDFALVCSNCEAQPAFTLAMPTAAESVCAGTPVTRQIDLGQVLGFQQPVTMSSTGMPAPGTVAFSPNPVATLPGSTTMTLNTSGVATGDYNVVATGTAGSLVRSATLPVFVAAAPPAAPTLTTPAAGASNVAANASFQWTAAANAFDYLVEIATDAAFTNIVASTVTRETSFTPAQALGTATQYFWRVTARNACPSFELFANGFETGGAGGSPVASGSFTTAPAPGDCPVGGSFTDVLSEDFEGAATGWVQQAGGSGTNTWAITPDFPFAGSRALRGLTPATASDQRFVSPSVALPSVGNGLTLSFMSRQSMERNSNGGCWDGGFIEVSTNGGSTWTQITSGLLTDPYDGALGTGNPAAPAQAWCGDPQAYLKSVIDLAPFAGQTVQFRLRVTSDGSVSRSEGWNIDNVLIRRCN